jgi:HEPN domain-containing protein
MTKVDIKKLITYWRKGSDLDFESAAEISRQAKRYVQACFFVHLSIEKALKAYFVSQNRAHAPYVHNLPVLAKLTNLPLTARQLKLLVEINDFNLRCRYPDDSYSIYKKANRAKTEDLLAKAGELRTWILEQLKQ